MIIFIENHRQADYTVMKSIDLLVGSRIRERRFQARLSLDGLASRIGLNAVLLLRYEKGEARVPAPVMMKLCNALGARAADFFEPKQNDPTPLLRLTPDPARAQPQAQPQAQPLPPPRPRDRRLAASLDRLARAERGVRLQDRLIARQAGLVEQFERDGDADLARIGRSLLSLFEATRALSIRDRNRLQAEMAGHASPMAPAAETPPPPA